MPRTASRHCLLFLLRSPCSGSVRAEVLCEGPARRPPASGTASRTWERRYIPRAHGKAPLNCAHALLKRPWSIPACFGGFVLREERRPE